MCSGLGYCQLKPLLTFANPLFVFVLYYEMQVKQDDFLTLLVTHHINSTVLISNHSYFFAKKKANI